MVKTLDFIQNPNVYNGGGGPLWVVKQTSDKNWFIV